jgi:Tfp pilus assembly protein PilF
MPSDRSVLRRDTLVSAALLALAVALVYAPVRHADFFNFDDPAYVTENPFVRGGLTLAGLRQAFFGSHGALWMPLSFTSHMVDVTLFGLTPSGPHLVNVAIHAVNAVLLLLLFVRATGALAPSLAVAALFALHPQRVESVAWIAERKDVLSALFGLLTLHAWVSWTRAPSPRGYALVVAGTVLALLAKPMLVTLPVLLLCFDWWPLHRIGTPDEDGHPRTFADLIIEKLPLVALAVVAVAITLAAANAEGGLMSLAGRSLPARLVHAIVSCAWYVWKTASPTALAVFYPMPEWTTGQAVAAILLLVALGAVAGVTRGRAPWIGAGLVWFVVGLLPVIGLLQAGRQGMADRFTYLPSIGLLAALVWSFDAAIRSRAGRAALAGAGVVAAMALGAASHVQAGYWRDSETLFVHTLAVTSDNWMVENALGNVLANADRPADAYAHFAEALRIEPDLASAAYGLGLAAEGLGRPEEALARYGDALRIQPTHWRAHNNLGVLLLGRGDLESALHHFSEAVRLDPDAPDARTNLRVALGRAGIVDANADRYVSGLLELSAAVANDADTPAGVAYGATLTARLLDAHPDAMHGCLAAHTDETPAPFDLYVEIAADGTLDTVTPLPPTRLARCFRDEVHTAHAPAPPFAPFHARVSVTPTRATARVGLGGDHDTLGGTREPHVAADEAGATDELRATNRG